MSGWLEPVEASAALVRDAGAKARAFYLIGALPFTLVLIWFAAEMLQSPYAAERLPGASLALALLFTWKQAWQGAYMASLRDTLAGTETPWTPARALMLLWRQAAWQPLALLAIPLGILAIVPGAWVFGYFRHLALDAATGAEAKPASLARLASQGGIRTYFPAPVFVLAGCFLFVNVFVLVMAAPQLLLSFFGVRSIFSSLGGNLVNGVSFAVAGLLTWMLLDPFIDAYFVLRAFQAESRRTGLDLRAALRRALPLLLVLVSLPVSALDERRFDRAADEVLRQEEFAWRTRATGPEGPVAGFFRRAADWMGQKYDDVTEWIRRTFFPEPERPSSDGAKGRAGAVQTWLLGLSAVVLATILVLLYRYWRQRRDLPRPAATPALARVDIADERVGAEALEEEGWLSLADELIAQGDYRLAMRALHLAGLRWLAGRGLLSLERWKSNADYARELERRSRSAPALATGFRGNLRHFEMIWYGRHDASAEMASRYRDAWKEMRVHAAAV